MNKQISMILAFLLVLSVAVGFGGCASAEDVSAADNVSTDTVSGESSDVKVSDPYEDDIGKYDFGGEKFRILTNENTSVHYNLDIREETGDILNDEIYRRNRSIEERFNLIIDETVKLNDDIRIYLMTGETEYSIVNTRCVYAFEYAVEGLLTPIYDIAAVNLDKAYWDKNATESISFGGQNFFAIGNYNLTIYDFIHIMCFNKELADNNGIDNLYELVNNGEWTYDKYRDVAKKLIIDVNGDGVMDTNDSYGYLSSAKQVLPNFWISAGQRSIYKNSDDIPEFKMGNDEKFFSVVEKIFNIHYDDGIWMKTASNSNFPQECQTAFQNGLALFLDCTFFRVNQLRAMETDFGIIPYPKWDEAQEKYYSRVEQGEFTCIPKANSDFEMVGIMLEALACESAKTVIPAYYELSLQGKVTRDNESVEMLDLIFDSRVLDWGDTIFCVEVRDGMLRDMFRLNDRDLASKTASMEELVNARITAAVDSLMK